MSCIVGSPENRLSFATWPACQLIIVINGAEPTPLRENMSSSQVRIIMITSPFNVYPLTSHFYMVKLGFTVVNIIFSFLLKNIDLWVLVRTASLRRFVRRFKRVPTIYAKIRKYYNFYLKIITFTAVKNHCVLHGRVFVMMNTKSLIIQI